MKRVKKIAVMVPVSNQTLADAYDISEAIHVMMAGSPAQGRYKTPWRAGYWAALEDIRAGRLALKDKFFTVGPNAFESAA